MSHRVIVVGAGIIGSSIAYYLAKNGADVTVLEQYRPACGATSKSFGWINANYPETKEYFALRQASMNEYHNLANELEKPIGLKWGGSLWWEQEGQGFDDHLDRANDFSYAVETVDQDKFKILEPEFHSPPQRSALFPNEGAVDAIACAKAMLNKARGYGAKLIIGCTVSELIMKNQRCIGVDTPFGKTTTDTVVVAAGAEAQFLLEPAGINLPMENQPGLILHTLPVEPILNHLIISSSIHFRQHTNGSLLVAEDFGGGSIDGDPLKFADHLINQLKTYLPQLSDLKPSEITLGIRPMPADGYPVLGEADGVKNLYIASMHSGVTLAPIVGKLACEEILHNKPAELFAPYRHRRFTQENN